MFSMFRKPPARRLTDIITSRRHPLQVEGTHGWGDVCKLTPPIGSEQTVADDAFEQVVGTAYSRTLEPAEFRRHA